MDIDNLVEGRELDALVAEKVMAWSLVEQECDAYPAIWITQEGILIGWAAEEWGEGTLDEYHPNYVGCAPDIFTPMGIFCPSTNIAAAWKVVEKLGVGKDSFRLEYGINRWVCYFGDVYANGGTAAIAICRAALKAKAGG